MFFSEAMQLSQAELSGSHIGYRMTKIWVEQQKICLSYQVWSASWEARHTATLVLVSESSFCLPHPRQGHCSSNTILISLDQNGHLNMKNPLLPYRFFPHRLLYLYSGVMMTHCICQSIMISITVMSYLTQLTFKEKRLIFAHRYRKPTTDKGLDEQNYCNIEKICLSCKCRSRERKRWNWSYQVHSKAHTLMIWGYPILWPEDIPFYIAAEVSGPTKNDTLEPILLTCGG